MVLPLAAQSCLYMKGSIRSWVHYIDLRTQQDTQKEHRLIAKECKNIFMANFPSTSEALNWNE
jgi:thymidylate synthase (FAD)